MSDDWEMILSQCNALHITDPVLMNGGAFCLL